MLPEVRGLILTGGASTRMGMDKADMVYGQHPQWRALEEMLRPMCVEIFWSCTPAQQLRWGIGARAILDAVPGHGPASGLHAAFNMSPFAWLVVGCDYPFLETRDVQSVLQARDPAADAVVFLDEHKNEIEPLIALWEPVAQAQFLVAFARGEFSPRRILRSCALKMIVPRDRSILCNRNTPR